MIGSTLVLIIIIDLIYLALKFVLQQLQLLITSTADLIESLLIGEINFDSVFRFRWNAAS